MNSAVLKTKAHYPILDGLRGVAAIAVVAFHIFEAHSTSSLDQIINHGYLAVDFFFLLSGFVIGYAYDNRWNKMTFGGFARRRLERLQPMVIIGMIIGAISFPFQASSLWPVISTVPSWKILLVMLVGSAMIPLPPSVDIRGWNETYPLNGPAWSLFYEYIVNILYGLIVRRFSKTVLFALVLLCAFALIQFAVTNPSGDVIGGWSLEPLQLRIGSTRVMFPFFAGILLFRTVSLAKIKNAFFWSSVLVLAVLTMPRIGGDQHRWANGLYESLSIILIFPLIVYIGASGTLKTNSAKRICRFLGDISYPVYITHYPLIYIYTAWVHDKKISIRDSFPISLIVFFSSISLAYVCLKFYDEPVRKWLKNKSARSEAKDNKVKNDVAS